MGAAAAPVVASIIVSVVVSEAIKRVGPKLGFSDTMVGIGAVVGGAYAGGMTYDSAMNASATGSTTTITDGNQVGMDLSQPAQGGGGVAGSDMAPSGGMLSAGQQSSGAFTTPAPAPGMSPSTPLPGTAIGPGPNPRGGGNPLALSSAPTVSPADEKALFGQMLEPNAAPAAPSTAKTAIDVGTVGNKAAGEKTWYEKLFTPEKTMDLLMAGMQGYSMAGMAKDDREYPEHVAKKNAKDWGNAYPGMLSLSQQYPSQQ